MTRADIDEAKRRLPLPALMAREGLADRAKKNTRCLFHDDEHPVLAITTLKRQFRDASSSTALTANTATNAQ